MSIFTAIAFVRGVHSGGVTSLDKHSTWEYDNRAFNDVASQAGNYYRKVAGVGKFGGMCTCPDGQTYEVGDNDDGCKSLACENGVSGECTEDGISESKAGYKVTCAKAASAVIYTTGADNRVYSQNLNEMTTSSAWVLASRSGVTSLAIKDDTIYATGTDNKIYKQNLDTMSTSSSWMLASNQLATSIAVNDDTVYVTGTDYLVYKQLLSEMSTRRLSDRRLGSMLATSKGDMTGIAIKSDTIYAIGIDAKIYKQTLSDMSTSSQWILASGGDTKATSIAIHEDEIYAVFTDDKIYKQTLSAMTTSSFWAVANNGAAKYVAIGTVSAHADSTAVNILIYAIGTDKKIYEMPIVAMASPAWIGVSKETVTSMAIKGDTVYATGDDTKIYKQELSAMSPTSEWSVLSNGPSQNGNTAAMSIAIKDDTVYVVASDKLVYKQLLVEMSMSSAMVQASMGDVTSIAINKDTIYATKVDHKVYKQILSAMTITSEWVLVSSGPQSQATAATSIAILDDMMYVTFTDKRIYHQKISTMTTSSGWILSSTFVATSIALGASADASADAAAASEDAGICAASFTSTASGGCSRTDSYKCPGQVGSMSYVVSDGRCCCAACDGTVIPCGPSEWKKIMGNSACGNVGDQSPIDVIAATAPISIAYHTEDLVMSELSDIGACEKAMFISNEHSVEVSFETEMTCKDKFFVAFPYNKGMGKRFYLRQFHFHSPSEHTVDGGYYPIEVHHTHIAENGEALIIAVLVKHGVETSSFLDNIFKTMPVIEAGHTENYYKQEKNAPATGLDAYRNFIPDMQSGFYYYTGSDTTPPCTTNTHWLIAATTVAASQATIDLYRTMINRNPSSQLAPFGYIVGGAADLVPTFHKSAGVRNWNASLNVNIRPIQALTGPDGLDRKVTKVLSVQNPAVVSFSYRGHPELIALLLAVLFS